jgi:hypothetical protein
MLARHDVSRVPRSQHGAARGTRVPGRAGTAQVPALVARHAKYSSNNRRSFFQHLVKFGKPIRQVLLINPTRDQWMITLDYLRINWVARVAPYAMETKRETTDGETWKSSLKMKKGTTIKYRYHRFDSDALNHSSALYL